MGFSQEVTGSVSEHHKRLNVFGWVDPVGGKHGTLKQEKGDTNGFLAMLKNIISRFKGMTIELWVDHARWHKGKKVKYFLSQQNQVVINYIPKYHPELNLQESLWRTMRYEETTNTYYESFDELAASVFNKISTLETQEDSFSLSTYLKRLL